MIFLENYITSYNFLSIHYEKKTFTNCKNDPRAKWKLHFKGNNNTQLFTCQKDIKTKRDIYYFIMYAFNNTSTR